MRGADGYYLMYLRKSRADEEKERYGRYETLAAHERELTELAAREGYHVAEVYRELVSGETIAKRPEFQRLLERVRDEDCAGVIVHAIDRLGRGDPMEYGWILSTLRFAGVLIVTPGRVYDPARADDMQQLKLQMFVSNIEFDHIRERLRDGAYASARRGSYIASHAPFGYEKAMVGRLHSLVPKEGEADTVRLVYRMASEGRNKGQIARHLNSSGIVTQRGNLWVAGKVGTLLSNPVYKGYVRYGYRCDKAVSRDGMRFVRKRTTNDDYVLVRGVHEALVTEDVWELANSLAFESAPVRRDRTIRNPLAGLIVCANCGRALVRQDVKNKYGRHYPRLHHAYHTECQCKSIGVDYVMGRLRDALLEAVEDMEHGVAGGGADPDELRSVEARIRAEDGRLDKLVELFCADAISVEEFKARRDASRELADRLRARRDELAGMDADVGELVVRAREAVSLIDDDAMTAEEVNGALRSFISRIEYRELDRATKNRKIELTVRFRAFRS